MYTKLPFKHPQTVQHTVPITTNDGGEHVYSAHTEQVTYHLVDVDINPTVVIDYGQGCKVEMVYPDFTCVGHHVNGHMLQMTMEDDVHVHYSTYHHSLKQEIILDKMPTSTVFTEIVYLKGLNLKQLDGHWCLINKQNEVVSWLVAPTVVESKGGRTGEDHFTFSVEQITKNTFKCTLTLDEAFARTANYPVIIDPTITTGYINDSMLMNNNRTTFTMSNGDIVVVGCNQQQVYYTLSTDSGQTWSTPVNTGLSSYNITSYATAVDATGTTLFMAAAYSNVGVKVASMIYSASSHMFTTPVIVSQGMYREFSNIDVAWNDAGQFLHVYTIDNTGANTYLTGLSFIYSNQKLLLSETKNIAYYPQDAQTTCAGIAIGNVNYVLVASNDQALLYGYGQSFNTGAVAQEFVTNRVRSNQSNYLCTITASNDNSLHIIYSTGPKMAEYVERTSSSMYTSPMQLPLVEGCEGATSCSLLKQGQLGYDTSNNSLIFLYNADFDMGSNVGALSIMIGTPTWEPYTINVFNLTKNPSCSVYYVSIQNKFSQLWNSHILYTDNNQYEDDFLSGQLQPTLYLLTQTSGNTYDDVANLSWSSIYTDAVNIVVTDKTGFILMNVTGVTDSSYALEVLGLSNGQYNVSLTPMKNGVAGHTYHTSITVLHQLNMTSIAPINSDELLFGQPGVVGGMVSWKNMSFLVVMDTTNTTGGIYYYDGHTSNSWQQILKGGLTTYTNTSAGQGGLTVINGVVWGIYVDGGNEIFLYNFDAIESELEGVNYVQMIDSNGNPYQPTSSSFAIGTDGTNILIYDGGTNKINVFSTNVVGGEVKQVNTLQASYTIQTNLNHQFGYDGTHTYWGTSSYDLVRYSMTGMKEVFQGIFTEKFDYVTFDALSNTVSACLVTNGQVSVQQTYAVSSSYLTPPSIIEPASNVTVDNQLVIQWLQPADPYALISAYNWFIANASGTVAAGASGTTSNTMLNVDVSNAGTYPNGDYTFYLSAVDSNNARSASSLLNFVVVHSQAPATPSINLLTDTRNITVMNASVPFTLSTTDTGTNMTGYMYWVENTKGVKLFNPRTVLTTDGAPMNINVNLVGAVNGTYVIAAYAMGVDREGNVITSDTVRSTQIVINAQFAAPTIIAWPAGSVSTNSNVVVGWELVFSPYDGQAAKTYYYSVTDASGAVVLPSTVADGCYVSLSANSFPSTVNQTYTLYVYAQDTLNNVSPAASQTFSFTPYNVQLNYNEVYPLNPSGTMSNIGMPIFYQYPGDANTPDTSLQFSVYITEYVNNESANNVQTSYAQWYVLDPQDTFVASDTATFTDPPANFSHPDAYKVGVINLDTHNLQSGIRYTLYVQQVTDKASTFASATFFANQTGNAVYLTEPNIVMLPHEYAANQSAAFLWSIPGVIAHDILSSGTIYSNGMVIDSSGNVISSGSTQLSVEQYNYWVTDDTEMVNYVAPTMLLPATTSVIVDTSNSGTYLDGKVYRFGIEAVDSNGRQGFTNEIDFLVNHTQVMSLPSAPIWILPISSAGNTMNTRPHFQFKLLDPLGNDIEGFRLQVASDHNFNTIVFDTQDVHQPVANGSVVSYIPTQDVIPNANQTATYFVRVLGWNNNGESLPSFPLQINFQAAAWMPLIRGNSFLTVDYIVQLRATVEASLEFYGLPVPNWTAIGRNGALTFNIISEVFQAINTLLQQEGVNAQFNLRRGGVLKLADLISLETNIMQS